MADEAGSGAVRRLHDDEVEISDGLARQLVAEQFPEWASLPMHRVISSGTVNVIYRLGDHLAIRLPRAPRFEEREADCWLQHLAGRLPLPIPEPVAPGEPSEAYPLHWTVHRWLDGEPWRIERVEDPSAAAALLAEFIHALRELNPDDAPCPQLWDGGTFAHRDRNVRAAAASLPPDESEVLLKAWDDVLAEARSHGRRTLIHWDLLPGNVLLHRGKLAGVIDWGALAFGDPSRDLLPTWTLFNGPSRQVFRASMAMDEQAWARAHGWGLAFVVGVAYYAHTNPGFAAQCRATLDGVLGEVAR